MPPFPGSPLGKRKRREAYHETGKRLSVFPSVKSEVIMFYVVKKTMFADGNDSLKEEVFVASTFQVAQQKADQLNNNWCTSSQAPSAFKPHEQCFDVITYSVQEDKY